MRRNVDNEVLAMIKMTRANPGKLTQAFISLELDISKSTVSIYSKELNLPIKKRRVQYSNEQIEFVKTHAPVMTNAEVSKHLGIQPYQAQDIAKKAGISFFVKKKEKVESKFFEHDKTGIW